MYKNNNCNSTYRWCKWQFTRAVFVGGQGMGKSNTLNLMKIRIKTDFYFLLGKTLKP